MVLAPEHALVDQITTPEYRGTVSKYRDQASRKSDWSAPSWPKPRPAFHRRLCDQPGEWPAHPIWIADYVLATYGTGAIMAVPGQDERDWELRRS